MRRLVVSFACAICLGFLLAPSAKAADPKAPAVLAKARTAYGQGKFDDAKKLADQALDMQPMSREGLNLRAAILAALGKHAEAVQDYTQLIEIGPASARLYDIRGAEHFKANQIEESIADFNRAVELSPELAWGHWQRGISYYYAGKYAEGKKQFEAYQKHDDNDVENAVWRYLCVARAENVEAAKKDILKIRDDPRVPMKQIYALYAGTAKPEDVLAAANAGKPSPEELNNRLFYAHLYLGLYYEVAGDKKLAQENIAAAEAHKIGHYMWDVARVHAVRLKNPPAGQ